MISLFSMKSFASVKKQKETRNSISLSSDQTSLPSYTFQAEASTSVFYGNYSTKTIDGAATIYIEDAKYDIDPSNPENFSRSKIEFKVDVPANGRYKLKVNYALPTAFENKNQFVHFKDFKSNSIVFENTAGLVESKIVSEFYFDKGNNTIEIVADFGYIYIDSITLDTVKLGKQATTCPGIKDGINGLFTGNGRLWDSNCEEVVLRGVNLQYGDRTNVPARAVDVKKAITSIKNITDSNGIRMIIRYDFEDKDKGPGVTDTGDIFESVDIATTNKMIPVLSMYSSNATCGNNIEDLKKAVDRWVYLAQPENGSLQNHVPFAKYGILNIVNEFGANGLPDLKVWKEAYKEAIERIREAGYTNPIMIDAFQCGQNLDSFLGSDNNGLTTRAQDLESYDSLNNMMFSIHAYYSWNSKEIIKSNVFRMTNSNQTWFFGEHGRSTFQVPNNTDEKFLWETCETSTPKLGWMSWSWGKGNGAGDEEKLNMSDDSEIWNLSGFDKLNAYGKQIVSDKYGIRNTSQVASSFEEETLKSDSKLFLPKKTKLISYPNPVSNILEFSTMLPKEQLSVSIYSMNKVLLLKNSFNLDEDLKLDLGSLKNGSYILVIYQNGKSIANDIIIKI